MINEIFSALKALSNYILSPFLYSPASPHQDRDIQERTLSEIELDPEADWKKAWEKNLERQTLYNNIVKEVFNSFTRIIGWHLISMVSQCDVDVTQFYCF